MLNTTARRWLRILTLAALLHAGASGSERVRGNPTASSAPPVNVSGTFRGSWTAVRGGDTPPLAPWVREANGSVLCVLTSRASDTTGVHLVKGDILLAAANGAAAEVRMAAEGLYAVQTGELRLLVSRSHALQDVTAEEAALGGRAFHRAQADAALEAARLLAGSRGGRQHPPLLSSQPRGGRWNATGLRRMCEFELTVKLPPTRESASSWRSRSGVRLEGLLSSPSCHAAVSLNATRLNTDALVLKARNVASLTATTGIALISLTGRQMESSSGSAVSRVSLACICHQAVVDSFFILVHLTGGLMVDSLFASFTSVALVFFLLFSFFEMRWMTLIARARAPNVPWREELNALQSRFYMALVSSTAFAWLARDSPTALSLSYGSFWAWQVAHTAIADTVSPFSHRYVIGTTLARLPIPLYFLGCPENWLSLPPAPQAAVALVVWLAAQAMLLCAQIQFGARCFVPPRWRPVRYAYTRPATPAERAAAISDDAETGSIDCVICMLPLDLDALEHRMLTPCGHAFHAECLQRWMAIRQECPVCRGSLPLP